MDNRSEELREAGLRHIYNAELSCAYEVLPDEAKESMWKYALGNVKDMKRARAHVLINGLFADKSAAELKSLEPELSRRCRELNCSVVQLLSPTNAASGDYGCALAHENVRI